MSRYQVLKITDLHVSYTDTNNQVQYMFERLRYEFETKIIHDVLMFRENKMNDHKSNENILEKFVKV